ncbi:MAG: universal stress protein [Acidimicrobiia bacterium]|nr:universal stress protein [Acidimicrobiia bacterium]
MSTTQAHAAIEPRRRYAHVIAAVDDEHGGGRAAATASSLAAAIGAQLHVFHAESHWDRRESGMHRLAQELAKRYGGQAHVGAEGTADRSPVELMDELADRLGNAALCVAARGHSARTEPIFGSVTAELIRQTGRAVIVAGPRLEVGVDVSRVIVGLDGSPYARAVLPEAAGWAAALGVPLWLVEVLDPGAAGSGPAESSTVRAEARRIDAAGLDVEWEVLHGAHPARSLVDWAATVPGSMLAIATHGRTGVRAVLSGSVATEVIRRAPAPVLVQHPA